MFSAKCIVHRSNLAHFSSPHASKRFYAVCSIEKGRNLPTPNRGKSLVNYASIIERSSRVKVLNDSVFRESSQTDVNGDHNVLTKDEANSPPTGSLFGAIALITGSTVGAGMLALPEVTAPAGFVPTAAGLLGSWALLAAEALLMAEVNLFLMEKSKTTNQGKMVTLRQMAEGTLGRAGKVVTVIYLLLSYCLLVAYLAKSSEVLEFFGGQAMPPVTAASILCASTAALSLLGGPSATDRVNQLFTSILMAMFVGVLGVGVMQNDVVGMLAANPVSWGQLSPAIPIIFLALVYHDLIPLICSYLGGDRKMVRSALLLGSLIPLAMFMGWEAVALALVPMGDGTTEPLQLFIQNSGPQVGILLECFSFLAVITSFTGTVMGLSETLRTEVPPLVREIGRAIKSDALLSYESGEASASDSDDTSSNVKAFKYDPGRVLAIALTLAPPLAFTAENPDAFLTVLGFAGGYGMVSLYGIMPPLMAWKLRGQLEMKQAISKVPDTSFTAKKIMMPGGMPVLAGVLAAASGVGLTRLAADVLN